MTTTRLYKSTDSGAPVLSGQAGSMVNLLQKCLVDGYGALPAAGWTRPFTGTNTAAFRNSVSAGGTGMYLRVVDTAATYATARAYSVMTTVSAGSNVAPHATHLGNGVYWCKSLSADSTARAWWLVADELAFYLLLQNGPDDVYVYNSVFGAGDMISEKPADAWRYFVLGRYSFEIGGVGYGGELRGSTGFADSSNSNEALWIGRRINAASGSIAVRPTILGGADHQLGSSFAPLATPSPGGGNEYWHAAWIAENGTLRGRLRGVYVPISALNATVIGTTRTGMPWAPSGSDVIVGRHSSHSYYTTYSSETLSGFGIETALEWG